MTFYSGMNKVFQKTRFLRRKEKWMAALNLGYLLAHLATGQMTPKTARIHFNCEFQFFEKCEISDKGSAHLIIFYEDRLRYHWTKRCEDGDRVNFEVEANIANKEIMESCKLMLEAVLQSTGLLSKGATEASPSAKDSDHAAALFKLQAAQH